MNVGLQGTRVLHGRCTPAEHRTVAARAQAEGLGVAQLVYKAVMAYVAVPPEGSS